MTRGLMLAAPLPTALVAEVGGWAAGGWEQWPGSGSVRAGSHATLAHDAFAYPSDTQIHAEIETDTHAQGTESKKRVAKIAGKKNNS